MAEEIKLNYSEKDIELNTVIKLQNLDNLVLETPEKVIAISEIIKNTPNDMELGKKIRKAFLNV